MSDGGFYNSGAKDAGDAVPSSDELAEKELEQSNGKAAIDTSSRQYGAGDLYRAEGGKSNSTKGMLAAPSSFSPYKQALKFFKVHKKGVGLGGGVIASIIAIVFFLLLALIPLKIESLIKGLESHFFSSTSSAMSSESEKLLSQYLKGSVFPSLRTCKGSTIDKSCRTNVFGLSSNPVTKLYKDWSNARLEYKLAADYGIEFKAVKSGGVYRYFLKAPGITGEEDITKFAAASDTGDLFQELNKTAFRQAAADAFSNETKWTQVMYRYKVGRLLEEKYGVKRCIFFCSTRDSLSNFPKQKLKAAQLYLVQRVITPLDASKAVLISCIIDPKCDPTTTKPTTPENGVNGELSGAPENASTDTAIRTSLEDYATKLGVEDDTVIQKLVTDYNSIEEKGFSAYVVNDILTRLLGPELAAQTTDAAPVVGQIKLVAQVVTGLNRLGPAIRKIGYLANTVAAVNVYMMFRTYADEIHTGHVDATEVGSMTDALGPGNQGGANDPEVGGTADATQTPLYGALIGNSSSSVSTSYSNPLSPTAWAATTTPTSSNSGYGCGVNNTPVPSGQLVCPEEKFGQGNKFADSITSFLNLPGISIITRMFGYINSALGSIFNIIGSIVGNALSHALGLVGININSLVNDFLSPAISFLSNKLIPTPFSSNMSGGRTFDMMAAGADVSGNDYAHTGLGGQVLSSSQYATIVNQQYQQSRYEFNHMSFFARVFSTSTPFSLASKLAADLPFGGLTSLAKSSADFITRSPFKLMSGLGSLFFNRTSAATSTLQTDPFGITQYGYPAGSISNDPEGYWQKNCSNADPSNPNLVGGKTTSAWNTQASQTLDPNTEMPMNNTTDQCLLINAGVGSVGGIYDTSLLTPDEQSLINGSSSSSGSGQLTPGCGGSGKYNALVSSNGAYAGTDQGIDFVPSSSTGFDICAPASGTITLADQTGHSYDRTTGTALVVEKLDQTPSAPSSSQYIYYAEIIQIDSSIQVGTHVSAGDVIGHNAESPGIEVGWGTDATNGFLCPIGNPVGQPTPCGESFNNWIQSIATVKP